MNIHHGEKSLLVQRLPVMRFIMRFDTRGSTNFGASGFDEATAQALMDAAVVDVWYYRAKSSAVGRRKVFRRYRKVSAGALMPRLAILMREELRAANLGSINGLDDGHGNVALQRDWKERRSDVKAAAARAWARLQEEG